MVDLNSDLGESFGTYEIGNDKEIISYATSVNVACGWHGGDPVVMEKTVHTAVLSGTAVGAHPGLPDLLGFGRRSMNITPEEARAYVKYQIGALMAFTKAENIELQHVKPHGALYNMAAKDMALAEEICQGIYDVDKSLILLGLSGSCLLKAAQKIGLKYASEVFADRAYNDDGTLVNRRLQGAVITNERQVADRVVRMVKKGMVTSISGRDIPIKADSICIHGDNPQALELVKKIKLTLEDNGIVLAPLKTIVRQRV